MSNINPCSVCSCNNGVFKIEDEVLILDFSCEHESHELLLEINSIGEAVN